jgi:hypothetical protein
MSHLKYCLGNVNQWRGVDYVETEGSSVSCKLCGTGWMHKKSAGRHFNSSRHESKYNAVKRQQQAHEHVQAGIAIATSLQPRINTLGHTAWQQHVQSLLYSRIMNTDEGVSDSLVKRYLAKYELMERTSLLELVVLKHEVQNDGTFSSMQEVYDYKALEDGFDPQAFLKVKRVTCGSDVIIPLVMKFLTDEIIPIII